MFHNRIQRGVGLLVGLVLMLFLIGCGSSTGGDSGGGGTNAGGDSGDNKPPTDTPPSKKDNPPVLKNLGVDFQPYDVNTGRAGDFVFKDNRWNKTFLEFQTRLSTFEYMVAAGTSVRVVADGVVTSVEFQSGTADYEIQTMPEQNSVWIVNYDHILEPQVRVGDVVTAGGILGKAGTEPNPYRIPEDPELGRTEIMISRNNTFYCPLILLDPSFLETYRAKVRQLMLDWETFRNSPDIYNEGAMVEPGCVAQTFTP